MIVCICNDVSSKDIITHVTQNNFKDLDSLKTTLSCCNQCEVCQHDIQDLINSVKI